MAPTNGAGGYPSAGRLVPIRADAPAIGHSSQVSSNTILVRVAIVGIALCLAGLARGEDGVRVGPWLVPVSTVSGDTSYICDPDGRCGDGESLITCPSDCGTSLLGPWSDPLRYFAFRYITDDTSPAAPLDPDTGLTRVELTIGRNPYPYPNVEGVAPARAPYVNFQTTMGSRMRVNLNPADSEYYVGHWVIPPMTTQQALQRMIAGGHTDVPIYALQYWNVEEIARADGDAPPTVGVWMNSNGTHRLGSDGKVQPPHDTFPAWPFDRYRTGETMVWSRTYNDWPPPEGDPERLYWNFHNPHVLTYVKLLAERVAVRQGDPTNRYLYCDNMYFHYGDVGRDPYNFFPPELTLQQRAEMYAAAHVPILRYLTERGFKLILNCMYRANTTGGAAFRDYINRHGAFYWANMFEVRFFDACNPAADKCRLVDPGDPRYAYPHDAGWHFLEYMRELGALNKRVLFSVNDLCAGTATECTFERTHSRATWELFLWVNLVANPGMTYLCHDPDINLPGAADYWWYQARLGAPLGPAVWAPGSPDPQRGCWVREFESGHRIVFWSGGREWPNVPLEQQQIYVERVE